MAVQEPFRVADFYDAVANLIGPEWNIVSNPPSGGHISRREMEDWADRNQSTDSPLVEIYLKMICHYVNTHANRIGPLAPPNAVPDVLWISTESYNWMLELPCGHIMTAIELRDRGITPAIFQRVQFVFMPMHIAAHWALVVISPVDHTVEILDSFRQFDDWQHRTDNVFIKVFQFLEYFLPQAAFAPAAGWRTMHDQSPTQTGMMSCGTYLCHHAMAIATRSEVRPHVDLHPRRHALRARIGAELLSGGFAGNLARRIYRHPGNGARNRNANAPWVPLNVGLLTAQSRFYRPVEPWNKQVLTEACQHLNEVRGRLWMRGHSRWRRGRKTAHFAVDIEQRLDDIYNRVYVP